VPQLDHQVSVVLDGLKSGPNLVGAADCQRGRLLLVLGHLQPALSGDGHVPLLPTLEDVALPVDPAPDGIDALLVHIRKNVHGGQFPPGDHAEDLEDVLFLDVEEGLFVVRNNF
jgi:hypothetical protein